MFYQVLGFSDGRRIWGGAVLVKSGVAEAREDFCQWLQYFVIVIYFAGLLSTRDGLDKYHTMPVVIDDPV